MENFHYSYEKAKYYIFNILFLKLAGLAEESLLFYHMFLVMQGGKESRPTNYLVHISYVRQQKGYQNKNDYTYRIEMEE